VKQFIIGVLCCLSLAAAETVKRWGVYQVTLKRALDRQFIRCPAARRFSGAATVVSRVTTLPNPAKRVRRSFAG